MPRVPLEIERRYYSDLIKMVVNNLEEITRRFLMPALPSLLAEAKQDLPTFDSQVSRRDNYGRTIDTLFSIMRVAFARQLTVNEIDEVTRKYAEQGKEFNKTELSKNLIKVLGVNPIIAEPYLDPIMRQFIDENTNLIRSIGEQYFNQVQTDTYNHIQVGVYNKEYATKIKAEYEQEFQRQFERGILQRRVNNADARARLIARDQISKYNGQLNKTRQTALGITKYKWITAGDERVRDSHAKLHGKIFSWDNPPTINGRQLNPGDDYQCRCNALPVFDQGVTENKNLLRLLNS
jgi:SPP1 gp7 family putative phage head morphogenesis protein